MKLKSVLGTWQGKLKGKDRMETMENYSIFFIVIGALSLSFGIGLSVLTEKVSVVFSVFGAWIVFISTVALIVNWVIKEFGSE